jgi:hypothetical protein
MSTEARKVRGRPFPPGNPGRPPGSKNKITQILEQLVEGQAEQLVQKVLQQALAGEVSSQRMMLDRCWPPRKAQPINVTIPPIKSSDDALAAIAAICRELGEGRLTPDEITALSSVIGRSIQVIEIQDLERRVAALEETRVKRDERKDSPPG